MMFLFVCFYQGYQYLGIFLFIGCWIVLVSQFVQDGTDILRAGAPM